MKNKDILELYKNWDGETLPPDELMELVSQNPFSLLDVQIVNYKAFSDKVSVKFEDNKKPILFVGINASGKTTIADAIATSLSKINSAIYNKNTDSGDVIEERDINKKNDPYQPALIELNLGYAKTKLTEVIVARSPNGSPKTISSTLIQAKKLGTLYSYILAKDNLDLPLYLFYGVDRSSLKTKDKFDKADFISKVERLNAIPQKLKSTLNFNDFLLWFKYLDDANNQDLVNELESVKSELANIEGKVNEIDSYDNDMLTGLNAANELLKKMNSITSIYSKLENVKNNNKVDTEKGKQLQKIKEIIITFIPNIIDIKIDRNLSYPFIVKKQDGSQFPLSELSQGEKSIISLVGDLVRRMLILNPHKENPLDTPAIVIIDELELHLHPQWQEEIISKLERTFKNTKFILTTHTPTIVSSIINENLYLIKGNQIIAGKHLDFGTYGAEYASIYTLLYNINSRSDNEIKEKLDRYLSLVNENQYTSEEAIMLRKELEKNFKGNEPSLEEAKLIIENKEWEKSLYEEGQ